MSSKLDIETRLSIRLKDFKHRNEAFVREEFLVPVFRCAGYDAVGTEEVLREVNLAKRTPASNNRRHIFPDFVLAKNGIALWIVDAKAPSTKPDRQKNIQQIQSYCDKLQCPNAMLSNALDTFVYRVSKNEMFVMNHFSKDDVCGESWDQLMDLLSPERTVTRIISFEDALRIYQTDEYVDRAFVMKVLQIYPFSESRRILENPNSFIYRSPSFRDRALAALLGTSHAHCDPTLFARIVGSSLNDVECVVRENFLTSLISYRNAFDDLDLPREIYDIAPSTPLEQLVFISFLKTTARGRHILNTYRPTTACLRDYVACVQRNPPVSFPLALPLNKPKTLSFQQYNDYLCSLPSIVEHVANDQHSHPETIKVLESCLSYCAARNQAVYKCLSDMATARQRRLLDFLSRRRTFFADTALSTNCTGFSRVFPFVGREAPNAHGNRKGNTAASNGCLQRRGYGVRNTSSCR